MGEADFSGDGCLIEGGALDANKLSSILAGFLWEEGRSGLLCSFVAIFSISSLLVVRSWISTPVEIVNPFRTFGRFGDGCSRGGDAYCCDTVAL